MPLRWVQHAATPGYLSRIFLSWAALITVCSGLLFSFVEAGRTIEDQATIVILKEVQTWVKK